jgi:hypothetical protein
MLFVSFSLTSVGIKISSVNASPSADHSHVQRAVDFNKHDIGMYSVVYREREGEIISITLLQTISTMKEYIWPLAVGH